MTCAEARDAMLVADVAELRGDGATPLARHVQECRTCHAAASRFLGGTDLLRVALEQRRTVTPILALPARRRRVAVMPAAFAAAALLAFAIVQQQRTAESVNRQSRDSAATVTAEGGNDALEAQGLSPARDSAQGTTEAPSVALAGAHAPKASDPTPDAAPIVPVIDESVPDHMPDGVAVKLQPGQHAAILHTSDPKTTIVWLY